MGLGPQLAPGCAAQGDGRAHTIGVGQLGWQGWCAAAACSYSRRWAAAEVQQARARVRPAPCARSSPGRPCPRSSCFLELQSLFPRALLSCSPCQDAGRSAARGWAHGRGRPGRSRGPIGCIAMVASEYKRWVRATVALLLLAGLACGLESSAGAPLGVLRVEVRSRGVRECAVVLQTRPRWRQGQRPPSSVHGQRPCRAPRGAPHRRAARPPACSRRSVCPHPRHSNARPAAVQRWQPPASQPLRRGGGCARAAQLRTLQLRAPAAPCSRLHITQPPRCPHPGAPARGRRGCGALQGRLRPGAH